MIISKTPFRISFVGGGSDIPSFYEKYGGAVVSTTIDKYVYVLLNAKFDSGIRLSYSRTEIVDRVEDIEHPIFREALQLMNITGGVEIASIADIPAQGTGLGSSSSFTVGLLNSLYAFCGNHISRQKLGRLSSIIEMERCHHPVGKQDQYAAAFGGLNLIKFNQDGSVNVSPIVCTRRTIDQLQDNLLLFYTGITRNAGEILEEQSIALRENKASIATMNRLVSLTSQLMRELRHDNVDAVGQILHEGWMMKRSLACGITNDVIDGWYTAARRAGAMGGKLLGAGGGGFFLFYAPRRHHSAIEAALSTLTRVPMVFEFEGSRIVFYNPPHAEFIGEELKLLA
jgi:D-glycero-alpha-D-manno-heptose-7-phosphate kinase